MDQFFSSGHAVDLILVVLAVEAVWLMARGKPPALVLAMLLPAGLMLLGLRAALTGMAWPWVAIPLALSFPVHLYDLMARFGSRRRIDET